jgi:hypothetical protein
MEEVVVYLPIATMVTTRLLDGQTGLQPLPRVHLEEFLA